MAPEWEISMEEYLDRLQLQPHTFEELVSLPHASRARKVIPLRDFAEVQSMMWMPRETIALLMRKIRTLGGEEPFAGCRIRSLKLVPDYLKVGQKFVYRENYQVLLEGMPNIFRNYITAPSFADLGPHFAFGVDQNGEPSLACYLPPIVEKHGADLVIMDGIHRSFIAKQAGKSVTVLLIEDVAVPFPCGLRAWEDISVISLFQRPEDISERFFELKKELFRDLKYLGIDG